jgi:hypothetical protein
VFVVITLQHLAVCTKFEVQKMEGQDIYRVWILKNGKWNIRMDTKGKPTDRKTKNTMAG